MRKRKFYFMRRKEMLSIVNNEKMLDRIIYLLFWVRTIHRDIFQFIVFGMKLNCYNKRQMAKQRKDGGNINSIIIYSLFRAFSLIFKNKE